MARTAPSQKQIYATEKKLNGAIYWERKLFGPSRLIPFPLGAIHEHINLGPPSQKSVHYLAKKNGQLDNITVGNLLPRKLF